MFRLVNCILVYCIFNVCLCFIFGLFLLGVYKNEPEAAHIFTLSSVSELRILTPPSSSSSPLIFGGAVTLNEAIRAMEEAATAFADEFKHCTEIANHWKKVNNYLLKSCHSLSILILKKCKV